MAKRPDSGGDPLDLVVPSKPTGATKGKRRATVEPSAVTGKKRSATKSDEPPKPPKSITGAPTDPQVETGEATTASEQEVHAARPIAAPGQYLTFFLGGEEYGAGILRVKEIIEFDALTKVPTTPPWIRGVINLRGNVVPVVDLAVKFGMAETAITQRTCVVIVEVELAGEATVMGVMVDAVSQVVELKADEIERAPAFGTRVHVDYLLGMGRLADKLLLLLDVDRVFSADEVMEASGTASQAPDDADLPAGRTDGESSDTPEGSRLVSTSV